MVVGELTERGLQELREEDERINELVKRQLELHDRVKESGLCDQSMQVFEDYGEAVTELTDLRNQYLYLQGAKDCVRLLKFLGVI